MSKIKICGLRCMEDIDAVNRALPDYAGFVFAPSRRRIDMETAAMLKEKLDNRVQAVGVFVNQDIDIISELCRRDIINLVQLHGDEDAEYIKRLRDICGCKIIKAVSIGGELPSIPEGADYLLFDTASDTRGGSGRTFNWNILEKFNNAPYFLAGGLTASNAGEAISLLHPYCVDVSGGVETDGVKDAEKIYEFVNLVRRDQDGKRQVW